MLGSSLATSWAWRVHLGFFQTSPAGGESAKEMSSTRLRQRSRHQQLLRQQQGRKVPAQPEQTSLICRLQVRVQKLEQAILRQAKVPCAAQQLPSQTAAVKKNNASMSFSKSLCVQFEHSRARNKQF